MNICFGRVQALVMSSNKMVSVNSNVHNTSQNDKYEEVEQYAGISNLPPRINANERKKIEPEQGYLTIRQRHDARTFGEISTKTFAGLIWVPKHKHKPPTPLYEHYLVWWPKNLCFKLKHHEQRITLNVMNVSKKIIYVQYKGLWNKNIKSGASWFVEPKTRKFIAPGMLTKFQVKARPHKHSSVQGAVASLQLATNFQRELVLGYFFVPIVTVFENYTSLQDLAPSLSTSSIFSPVEWAEESTNSRSNVKSNSRSNSDLSHQHQHDDHHHHQHDDHHHHHQS